MTGFYFDKVDKITVAALDVKVIDGHLWVTDGTKVQVWNLWGDVDNKLDLERNTYYDLIKGDFRTPVKVIEFTVENGAGKLADAGDKVWITNAVTFTSMISVKKDFSNVVAGNLPSLYNVVHAPRTMYSDFIYGYGKLWMVSYPYSTGVASSLIQTLCTYDGTWIETTIPTKPQTVITKLVDGLNGFVYASRFNQVGVAKFASSTSGYVTTIRVNAQPTALLANGLGVILVNSYQGMVSSINAATDVVTNSYSTLEPCSYMVDMNDGFLWAITDDMAGMIRVEKSSKLVRYTLAGFPTAPQDDYKFEVDDIVGSQSFEMLVATLPYNMQYWDGSAMQTVIAYPRLCLVTADGIHVIRMKDTLHRKPHASLKAYGYITTGPYDYAGD